MKSYKYLFLPFFVMICFSCAKEQIIPVKTDFTITVVNNDYSVPVTVEIHNKTEGADTYEWSFEGASTTSSLEKNPKPIVYTNKGNYSIRLKASNKDGSVDEKNVDIQIDAAMKVDFEWEMIGSDIAPVTIQLTDKSLGALKYEWSFEGGNPSVSSDAAPKVTFISEGEHKITLTISNGRESYSTEKTIRVKPAMTVGFDWKVEFVDTDYQAPVTLYTVNNSTNANRFEWEVIGAQPAVSNDSTPVFLFSNPGTYSIVLKAGNDKEIKILSKQVIIYPDNNLLSFTNIKLGINTAQSSIGCYFSSILGRVVVSKEAIEAIGAQIDFAYFGLSDDFLFNQFLSPNEVQKTAFLPIPNAIHTKIINSQELVGVQFTPEQFDVIDHGNDFSTIIVSETNVGKSPFDNKITPRIVLFQTDDGRKGAIKINSFIQDGKSSYILVDIKIQKKA